MQQTLIFGGKDRTVPGNLFAKYVEKAKAGGDKVVEINMPESGHFDYYMPGRMEEEQSFAAILKAAGIQRAIDPRSVSGLAARRRVG